MNKRICFVSLMILSMLLSGCVNTDWDNKKPAAINCQESVTIDEIPAYAGTPYVQIEDNEPDFTEEEKVWTDAFESYSELDSLGRCGTACANICEETQPATERGKIGNVKPTGWHMVKYHDLIDDNYLYNRCHLIGYQLSGENANERNLITGTRYMNVDGMLPFENEIDDYVEKTSNHVLYRVTPIYDGDNLVASGVEMEAWSVEDEGEGICFHVFCYNVQPGIAIDYATGESEESGDPTGLICCDEEATFIANKNTRKFHRVDCDSVKKMSEHNKLRFDGTAQEMAAMGYEPCQNCLGKTPVFSSLPYMCRML